MKKKLHLFILLAVILAACKSKQQENHDHAAAEVKIQYTAYSNEFELFAEADPFIVGKPASVLSHLSYLPSFLALESGSVTIRLVIGSKEVTQVLDKPTRKGIYKFELKPEIQGKGKLVYDFKIDRNEYQLVVPNVTVYFDELEAMSANSNIAVSRTNTVVFTKEQSWKVEFGTDLPRNEPFGQVIKTSALVQSAQGDEEIVAAKTNGIIIFKGENILEGKNVSTGQNLFTISGKGMADNSSSVRFSEAQNNYEKANADYERIKELAKDKIVSEKELLVAKNEFDNAKAVYDNLRNNFSANGQLVTSPLNGFVKNIYVKNGEYVEAGQPILAVSQNRSLLLQADVQQKYASILGSISTANIRTSYDNQTYSLEELNGKIVSYGKSSNQDNYLIPVSVQIDNKGGFVSGAIVEMYLRTITNVNALTIPNTALVEDQGNFFVYVQINPELFEKREVKIGSTDGLRTEVLKGIAQGERIVTKGAIQIKLAQATGTLDAHSGHNH